jgi:hypothetical protein
MKFFGIDTVLRPRKSRSDPGYFLLLMALFISCNNDPGNGKPEPKIAKQVPAVRIDANDPGFLARQDTVFFHGNLFSGYRFQVYDNGDTSSLQSFFNGVEEGWQRKWYDNGQCAEERFYINGKKEGLHKGWWADGKEKFKYAYYNNESDGECKEWYASGVLAKDFHYVKGYEDGSERLWWENAAVRANYVIKKGKKYGLIGIKTCVNPYDSVVKK